MLISAKVLSKLKRLYSIKILSENKSIDDAITIFKPPIFWKEKEIVKNQSKIWNKKDLENLISETNKIELLIKKNYFNSLNIISDFILSTSKN